MVFNGCANVLPCCEELSVGMLKRGSALVAFEEAAVTERHTHAHTQTPWQSLDDHYMQYNSTTDAKLMAQLQ
jgi:hypothetical protein